MNTENRGLGGGAAGFLALLGFSLAALLVVLLVGGCESPAAMRERARAERALAEAQAYQQKRQADTEAASERAAIRQVERDAAHQRALETLPYVALAGGGVLVLVLLVLAAWDLRSMRRQPTDPAVLLMLERLRLEQQNQWRVLAHLERSGEVVVYQERGKE